MKILVTGGAGFVGSHIVDRLVARGHQVVVLDNLSTGTLRNVNPAAAFHQVDIRDVSGLRAVFDAEKPEAVSHHAAQIDVTRSVSEPGFDADVNIVGGINVLSCAIRSGVRRFTYASTAAVYGNPQYVPIDENHPVAPLSAYGLSKYTFERYLKMMADDAGISHAVLRYANVFGPRQIPHGEGGVVAVFATRMLAGQPCRIFGNGDKTRDYVYVEDVAAANVLALESQAVGVFNIGTGKEIPDQVVFDSVRAAAGSSQEPIYVDERPGEIRRSCFNNALAADTFGWKPTVSFADGVELAVDYYKRKGDGVS